MNKFSILIQDHFNSDLWPEIDEVLKGADSQLPPCTYNGVDVELILTGEGQVRVICGGGSCSDAIINAQFGPKMMEFLKEQMANDFR